MHNRNSHWDIIMKRKGEKVIRAPLKDIFDRKCRNKSTTIWKNKIWKGIDAYYRLNNDMQCYLSSVSVCGQVMTRNCPVYNKLFIRFLCKCTFCHRDTWRELGAMIWSHLVHSLQEYDYTVHLMSSCWTQALADCSVYSSHCNHMEKSQTGSRMYLFPGSLSPDQLSFCKDLCRATSHLAFILYEENPQPHGPSSHK